MSCAKTAEQTTEMQFRMLSWANPGNIVLHYIGI